MVYCKVKFIWEVGESYATDYGDELNDPSAGVSDEWSVGRGTRLTA